MGSGIAQTVATAGVPVIVHEPDELPLKLSQERVQEGLERSRPADEAKSQIETITDRIRWTTDRDALATADLVIEAIVEDESAKQELFRTLSSDLPETVLLASNTSSVPIASLAANAVAPERVLGLHFFSPVPRMSLVEVVVALDTSDAVVAAAEQFLRRIGKVGIRTKDRSGFVVNFLLVPYLMAAVRMYEDGFATRDDIDAGIRLGCGHPMGPLQLCDLIGLDVLYAVSNSLYEEFRRSEYAPPPLLKRLVSSGHLGRKSGRGFYDY